MLWCFTYILQFVSWIGRSQGTASNLISVCPNNCSVMTDRSCCTRFCFRWERLDDCLGDIIDLERHIYISPVYLDDTCKRICECYNVIFAQHHWPHHTSLESCYFLIHRLTCFQGSFQLAWPNFVQLEISQLSYSCHEHTMIADYRSTDLPI